MRGAKFVPIVPIVPIVLLNDPCALTRERVFSTNGTSGTIGTTAKRW